MSWSQPTTVVEAKPSVGASGSNTKSVLTFIPNSGEKARVTGVEDGDGVYLKRGDGRDITCRLDFINAPEVAHPKYSNKPAQAFGNESKKTLEDMIANKEVTLRVSREMNPSSKGQDKRALCQIEIEGKDVSTEMLRNGMAWLYRRYGNNPVLSGLENKAKKDKVGLWSDPNPINPEVYSHMKYR